MAQMQPPVGQEHLKSRKTMLLVQSDFGFTRSWLLQRLAPFCPAQEESNTGVWTDLPEPGCICPHSSSTQLGVLKCLLGTYHAVAGQSWLCRFQ